jgi:hypothetical protein
MLVTVMHLSSELEQSTLLLTCFAMELAEIPPELSMYQSIYISQVY